MAMRLGSLRVGTEPGGDGQDDRAGCWRTVCRRILAFLPGTGAVKGPDGKVIEGLDPAIALDTARTSASARVA